MVTIRDILKPRHVDLALPDADIVSAATDLAERLQADNRVANWTEFQEMLRQAATERLTVLSCGAVLCHARTAGVSSMLMAAGRFETPVLSQNADDGEEKVIRYLFVIGLPPTMASEYLRVVGALARMLKDDATLLGIDAVTSAEEFVEILSLKELTASG